MERGDVGEMWRTVDGGEVVPSCSQTPILRTQEKDQVYEGDILEPVQGR